jgi:hypothetical protein
MSQVVAGKIDSIRSKLIHTKFGDKPVYHASIGGQEVNLGFKHNFVEGENVTLNVDHKYGGLQLIPGTEQKGLPPGGATPAPSNQTSTSAPVSRAAFPTPKDTKEVSIIRQNSGQHASRMVAALINSGAITTKDAAIETFIEYAYQITDFATGWREVKQAEAMEAYDQYDQAED